MNFVFTDRESTYPNRYLITRDNGATEYVVLERADEPVVVGTPLNAETFNTLSEALAEVVTTQAAVAAINITQTGSVITMTNTLDNNATEVLEIALDETDTPTQITANGVVIPITWEGF